MRRLLVLLLALLSVSSTNNTTHYQAHFNTYCPRPIAKVAYDFPVVSSTFTVQQVAEQSLPSVVVITNTCTPKDKNSDHSITVSGSGFFISPDGQIITNYHVIKPEIKDGDSVLKVILYDGTSMDVKVIGFDPELDIALLKVNVSNHSFLTFGDSEKLHPGESLVAIGEPYGFDNSVTAGIVSNKHRKAFWGIQVFVQTDTAINHGNSGGPLLNLHGQVIGVNTLTNPEAHTLSLSVCSAQIVDELSRLQEGGMIMRGFLGINVEVPRGIPTRYPVINGIPVVSIDKDSPAYGIGLEPKDLIIMVDGEKVKNGDDLLTRISSHAPGDVVLIMYKRGDNIITSLVRLKYRDILSKTFDDSYDGKV